MVSITVSIFSAICLLSILLCIGVNGDLCSPSPCGPNTNCKLSPRGVPTCYCKDTYYGQDPIKEGCKRECENNENCKDSKKCLDYQCVECTEHSDCSDKTKSTCFAHRCVDICKEVKCGIGAQCETTPSHQALCSCPAGGSGNPIVKCD